MNDDRITTDLKKDELSSMSIASDVVEDIAAKRESEKKIFTPKTYEETSCSSVLELSDPWFKKAESHSTAFRTSVVASRYKITLIQAYRMALNTAVRAQLRAFEVETNIEDL